MTTVLQQSNSVYIPSIIAPTRQIVDVQFITELFETRWCLGEVNRVDIIDVVNEHGERVGGKRAAFVHMNHWATNDTTSSIIEEINKEGKCILWLTHNTNRGRGCYWTLKKMNREPVQETQLNVHQLAARVLELEELVKVRDNQINEMDSQHKQYISQVQQLTTSLYDEIEKRDIQINDLMSNDNDELNTAVDYGTIDNKSMIIDELNTSVDSLNIQYMNNSVENHTFERQISTWVPEEGEPEIFVPGNDYDNYYNILNNSIHDNDFELSFNIDDDDDDELERPILTAWHKYRHGGSTVNSKEFIDILNQSREEDLKNNIDPLIEYGYDFYDNPNGSYSMKCNVVNKTKSNNNDNDVFETKLDINIRKQFTSHLCNN